MGDIVRLAAAMTIGFIVGLERERHHRPAGIKTHIMVCVGAAAVSMIQLMMIDEAAQRVAAQPELSGVIGVDYARLGAQVISGIGFLGAGTILQRKGAIKGLTTAATLWLVACLGLAVGMGYYVIAGVALVLVMLVLVVLRRVQQGKKNNELMLEINFSDRRRGLNEVTDLFAGQGVLVKSIEFPDMDDGQLPILGGEPVFSAVYTVIMPRGLQAAELMTQILLIADVLKVAEQTE